MSTPSTFTEKSTGTPCREYNADASHLLQTYSQIHGAVWQRASHHSAHFRGAQQVRRAAHRHGRRRTCRPFLPHLRNAQHGHGLRTFALGCAPPLGTARGRRLQARGAAGAAHTLVACDNGAFGHHCRHSGRAVAEPPGDARCRLYRTLHAALPTRGRHYADGRRDGHTESPAANEAFGTHHDRRRTLYVVHLRGLLLAFGTGRRAAVARALGRGALPALPQCHRAPCAVEHHAAQHALPEMRPAAAQARHRLRGGRCAYGFS